MIDYESRQDARRARLERAIERAESAWNDAHQRARAAAALYHAREVAQSVAQVA